MSDSQYPNSSYGNPSSYTNSNADPDAQFPPPAQAGFVAEYAGPPRPAHEPSDKDYVPTWLLSLFLGVFGADRFYLGKTGTAIAKLLTVGGLGVWWLVDLILAITGNATDRAGRKVRPEGNQHIVAWSVSAAFVVVTMIVAPIMGIGQADEPTPVAQERVAVETDKPTEAPSEEPVEAETVVETEEPAELAEPAQPAEPEEPVEAAEPEAPAEETGTVSQQQAIKSAKSYLNYTAFSRSGLIAQLEYEGFSTEDATYAVDAVGADWNAQAVAKAEDYLDYTAFSRTGLIDQLLYEGFTDAEATHGVDSITVDWYEQAAKKAQDYLDYSAFSRSSLIDQLIYEGFTASEAEYGVNSVGL